MGNQYTMQTPHAVTLPFKKKLALDAFRLHRWVRTKEHKLVYLFWECTLRCNLNCVHCGSDCGKDSGTPDMPLQDFLNVLDHSILKHPDVDSSRFIVVLTGGEPSLRKDLVEIGTQLQKRGLQWGMVTNGLAMNEQRLHELVKVGFRSMTISLDGLEASHNTFRGNSHSWQKCYELLQAAGKIKGFTFDAATCVNQLNLSELDTLKQLLLQANVRLWRLFTVFPKGRAKEHDFLFLSPDQFRTMFAFIQHTRQTTTLHASYGCEGYLGSLEGQVRSNPFFCQAGISIGSILADGSISACPSLRADYIQGNIYSDDFMDVWQNKYQRMRNRSWAKTGICKECSHWKYCQGNGLHLRDEKTGELLMCHMHKLQQ
jgi:radical SAM enzyme (rSAM/lipoprotein system)